eukprot:6260563-Amphidinium_carterae.1
MDGSSGGMGLASSGLNGKDSLSALASLCAVTLNALSPCALGGVITRYFVLYPSVALTATHKAELLSRDCPATLACA